MDPMQKLSAQQPVAQNRLWIWIIAIAAVVIAALVWRYVTYEPIAPYQAPAALETPAPLTGGDTTQDIQDDLQAIDVGDVDTELNSLDRDINQL